MVDRSEPRDASAVTSHYGRADLAENILGVLGDVGHDVDELDPDVLAAVDEFHLGGRRATMMIAEAVGPSGVAELLDVGCGIGGAARVLARELGAEVTGIDLTAEFVEAARELTARCGLDEGCRFDVASALDLPFSDRSFDAVTMLHVGMNIADKQRLTSELVRVLRPGGTLAIYDVMRVGEGEIVYPVPWATDAATSFVSAADDYVDGLTDAGVDAIDVTDHTDLVLEVMAAAADAPPAPASLVHLMGPEFPTMLRNAMATIRAGMLAPTSIVART